MPTRDLARLLGLHPNTVRRWSNQGLLKAYRIGPRGDRRFRREDDKKLGHLGYHEGEMCPYAEKTGRNRLLCEEGFCCRCQIWDDFTTIKGVSAPNCPLKLEVCFPSCYWWHNGNCALAEAKGEA